MKFFIFFLFLPILSSAQTITDFAGCASCTGGDGSPATVAALDDPGGSIFTKDGIFYVASGTGNKIRKVDNHGIITTVAGDGYGGYTGDGGPATAARLKNPVDVTFDTLGNLFFSDAFNHAIRKVNISTGIITTICGNGSAGFSGDGGPASAALLYGPNGICFDKSGNLYIADCDNNRIRKIDTAGIITTFAGNGIYGYNGDGMAATMAQLYLPTDVVADDTGSIFIADESNFRVRKVNTAGIITTFAGNGISTYIGDGMAATSAPLDPAFLKIDSFGNFYITSEGNYRVFKIDTAGIFHCVAGDGIMASRGDGGPATAASFYYPSGLSIDKCNNIYIGDVNSNEVRKVTFYPSCSVDSLDSLSSLIINPINVNPKIIIFPNPAYSELSINSNNGISQVTISNVMGQVASPLPIAIGIPRGQGEVTQVVDVSGLPPGVYVVRVTDGEGDVVVRKVVKE